MTVTMAGQSMPLEAVRLARRLRRRSNRLTVTVVGLWRRHAGSDLDESFALMMPDLFAALDTAQYQTARDSMESTPRIMRDTDGTAPAASYDVSPWQWVGVNGNGMSTLDTMWSAIVTGKMAIGSGLPLDMALHRVEWTLAERARTLLADTQRSTAAVAARSRSPYAGYVRCLTPPSCPRCVILAGRRSGSIAFQRHPNCDCTAVYTAHPENGMLTDPIGYLNELDDAQLARALGGESYAQAYRDGADLYQLVNAQRGIRSAQLYGRNIRYTTEGLTKRGFAGRRMIDAGYAREFVKNGGRYTKVDRPRLMPETIYELCANDPEKARRMLYDYGWII